MINPNQNFPFGPIDNLEGRAIALRGDDIDTDRIIPARFLKCINFESLGDNVFSDDRLELNGEHPFDKPKSKGASLLIVNDNFGCGSSREHAPQALMRWGIRAIVGQSFAEIFYGNCLSLGIPCVKLANSEINDIQSLVERKSNLNWTMSLTKKSLSSENNFYRIEVEKGSLEMLIKGSWDGTAELIANEKAFAATQARLPYLNQYN